MREGKSKQQRNQHEELQTAYLIFHTVYCSQSSKSKLASVV